MAVWTASDGEEGARIYRQEHDRIDLVISSGFTKDESLNDLKKLGLAGYISKPFHMAELSEVIKSVL